MISDHVKLMVDIVACIKRHLKMLKEFEHFSKENIIEITRNAGWEEIDYEN